MLHNKLNTFINKTLLVLASLVVTVYCAAIAWIILEAPYNLKTFLSLLFLLPAGIVYFIWHAIKNHSNAKFYKPQNFLIFSLLFLLPVGFGAANRNTVWESNLNFWEDIVIKAPLKARGHKRLFRPLVEAELQESLTKKAGKKYFMRCIISREEGKYVVTTTGEQGSGILMSMVKANGLIVAPEEKTTLTAGEMVTVYLLNRDFECSETPYTH